jgi:hypothetical protein
MKKYILLLVMITTSLQFFAQSEKYTQKMTDLIAQMDSTIKVDAFNELATSFERIGEAEKTQWLPYYYAALSKLNAANMQLKGEMGDNTAITDPAADKAEELLNKAIALGKENSETWIVKKMIASLRMMGNAMQRFMEYGPLAAEALETAKKLDANNPRVYLMEGMDKFYTPEQFGGDKAEAKKLFKKVQELQKTFKPETTLHPNWGSRQAAFLLSQK